MPDANSAVISGRLTANPVLKTSQNGRRFLRFVVGVARPKAAHVDLVDVISWRVPEDFHLELHTGRQVSVAGYISVFPRTYFDRQGQPVTVKDVTLTATKVELLGEPILEEVARL